MEFKENRMLKKQNFIVLSIIQKCIKKGLFYLFRIFPIDNKKIVMQSFKGMGYCDSPKYISEQLLYNKTDCQIVWITRNEYTNQFPPQITLVPFNSIRAIKELVTAKVWIDNCRKEIYVRKRKGQFYLETWHNGISLKQVEADAENVLSINYIASAKNDSKMVNAFLSNSIFSTERLKRSFWYTGQILEFGLPRNDILFKFKDTEYVKNVKRKICNYFNLSPETKILIYAPTFRRNYDTRIYLDDFNLIIKELNKISGSPWNVLMHFHPNLGLVPKKQIKNVIFSDNYPDFQEMLLVADVLLTDYSSTMFEFSFMSKPVFLYAPDIENYKMDRNFTFDLNELPWAYSETLADLLVEFKKFNMSDYLVKLNKFMKKLGVWENGNASYHVTKYIETILKGE